jgi:hypothetical protein
MLLAKDLTIQNLDTADSIDKLQEQLKKALVFGYRLLEIEAEVAHGTISQCKALY